MFEPPSTRYAKAPDGAYVAYQELGEGEPILVIHPFVTHLDFEWEGIYGGFMRELAVTSRVIMFDKRGMGLSDRLGLTVNIDARIDDVRAVLDAAGTERTSIFGHGEGAALGAMFAATEPTRVKSLVALWPQARTSWAEDYPWGEPSTYGSDWFACYMGYLSGERSLAELIEITIGKAGQAEEDPRVVRWVRSTPQACAPGGLLAYLDVWAETDVRDALPSVRCPALVLPLPGQEDEAQHFAELVPGARTEVLSDTDWIGVFAEPAEVVGRIRDFLALPSPPVSADRVLSTVLFTDIVGSTQRAFEMGDGPWRELIAEFESRSHRILEHHRGLFDHTTGDGMMARFDGPARSVLCAHELVAMSRELGTEIRAGAHTGEVELTDAGAHGLAVHVAARVASKAGASEVWVSSTVKDLTAGSGLTFEDAGEHELKGVPDRWRLYKVVTG